MINKIKQIFNWASLKKGVIKGYSIPLLPDNINKFYNLPIIRILRVIGGFCAVLILTKSYLHLPEIIRWIVLIFGIIQLLQIVIISIIKVIYGIKKLKNNSKDFEVRNSPLNQYATKFASMAYCWRVGCTVIGGGAGFIASSAAIDQALEAGGQSKIFLPIIGKGISSVFGNKNKDPVSIYDNIQKNIKELSSAEERNKYISQCISKIDSEGLNDTNISDLDKSEIKKALEEVSKANQEELKVFRNKILSEIEKLKTNK